MSKASVELSSLENLPLCEIKFVLRGLDSYTTSKRGEVSQPFGQPTPRTLTKLLGSLLEAPS